VTWISDDAIDRLRCAAEQPDLSGTPYQLLQEIGRGGMGVVYEARDLSLQREVAVKVVATELPGHFADRLLAEACIVARLEHPGIVPVHAAGVLDDGRAWYAMQRVRGVDLHTWMKGDGAAPERLRIFLRICEPVAFAHSQGIVHRDLKPGNVMIGEFGSVLVMDWGLAAAGVAPAPAGTPGFMSPEQLAGEDCSPAADVFALGAILRLLTEGTRPPRRLAAIISKATHRDAGQRYPDATALADDVRRFIDGEPVRAYREQPWERAARWMGANRVLLSLVAAYLLMRIVVFLWMRL
jgi:serine/threonine protein kinase